MKLDKTVAAIVTGGASGLGAATVKMLAQAGVKVAIFDRDQDKGYALAKATAAVFCETDIVDEASVDAALKKARDINGIEKILVNCAGIAPGARTVGRNRETGKLAPHDLATFRKTIEINLIGTFHMMTKSAVAMAGANPSGDDESRGVIITTASIAAMEGQVGQAAYAASKGGIVGLTLPVARDLAPYGIRVVAIAPGLFHTPMFESVPDDIRHALEANVPFPSRLGKPSEYAELVRSIVENDMLNGTTIRLDGALRMQPK